MFSAERYQALFMANPGPEGILHEGVHGYRVKRIQAGDTLEIEAFPIWNTAATAGEARRQSEKHREAVKAVNLRNTQKNLRRLMNANFGEGDILLTLTYRKDQQPESEQQAQRDIRNYLRRLRSRRGKMGLPELKYIYITETTHGESGTRYHHHLIVNGGISRDEIEKIWQKGIANSRGAQPDDFALSGWAHYMSKQKTNQEKAYTRGYAHSKNLKQPKVTYADHKLSRRGMQQISQDMKTRGTEILEKLYPGYKMAEAPQVRVSAYVPGGYLLARMIRRTDPGQ